MGKLALILCLMVATQSALTQALNIIKYDELDQVIKDSDSDLTIVNFWATWCGPCIKELPHFDEASSQSNLEIILVSLDFPDEIDKVKSFIRKKGFHSSFFLLDETDYDSFMPKVSESWSGALPATLMLERDGSRHFYEKAFSRESLFNEIEKHTD